jgi:arylsulfatase
MGSRGIVRWPYKAVSKHIPGTDYDEERWELFDLQADPSECEDLAEAQPPLLAELIELWWSEAERHGVLPLDDRGIELFGARFREHSPHPISRRYRYRPPMSPIPAQAAAPIGGRNFELVASVTRSAGDGGVLFATGTENSGLALFVENDRLVLDYNAFGDHTVIESDGVVPDGACELGLSMERTGDRGAVARLSIDGSPVGEAAIPFYMRIISSVGASVGFDYSSAVSPRYQAPNPFSGTLHEVVIQLAPSRADSAEARAAFASQ